MEDEVKQKIQKLVDSSKVFLFMKGSPDSPQCGFSAKVVEILNVAGAEFESFDVLEDFEVREGVKEFGSWPTLPQLYVEGKLVGGCDIIMEMQDSGELQKALGL
tara:strand:+ start:205 stop:516 length:312 start_codon:yes stop_codon:yes gene_type:complete